MKTMRRRSWGVWGVLAIVFLTLLSFLKQVEQAKRDLDTVGDSDSLEEVPVVLQAMEAARPFSHLSGRGKSSPKGIPRLHSDMGKEEAPFSVLAEMPSMEQMQQDLTSNPHGPSSSLIAFGRKVEKQWEQAIHSIEKTTALFEELKHCLLDVENATTTNVQVYCFMEMQGLVEHYPTELTARWNALLSQIDPRVLRITEAMRRH